MKLVHSWSTLIEDGSSWTRWAMSPAAEVCQALFKYSRQRSSERKLGFFQTGCGLYLYRVAGKQRAKAFSLLRSSWVRVESGVPMVHNTSSGRFYFYHLLSYIRFSCQKHTSEKPKKEAKSRTKPFIQQQCSKSIPAIGHWQVATNVSVQFHVFLPRAAPSCLVAVNLPLRKNPWNHCITKLEFCTAKLVWVLYLKGPVLGTLEMKIENAHMVLKAKRCQKQVMHCDEWIEHTLTKMCKHMRRHVRFVFLQVQCSSSLKKLSYTHNH